MADGRMKKFIIIGNGNAVTYKEIFPLIKENKLWLGAGKGMGGKTMEFTIREDLYDANKGSVNRKENGKCYVSIMMCTWFTNVEHTKRHPPLDLYKRYSNEYPKYDNYDAIEVSKVSDIPMDYDGVMGVPITFLFKYCPEQFEIIGLLGNFSDKVCAEGKGTLFHGEDVTKYNLPGTQNGPVVIKNNVPTSMYKRILIRKRNGK